MYLIFCSFLGKISIKKNQNYFKIFIFEIKRLNIYVCLPKGLEYTAYNINYVVAVAANNIHLQSTRHIPLLFRFITIEQPTNLDPSFCICILGFYVFLFSRRCYWLR